jgi:predicted RNA-binding Zn-ribbon protein involved in translation (DUF1610 family)
MRLATDEFIRRFLSHVLPSGLHRIRHYGLFANVTRKDNLAQARELLIGKKTEAPTEGLTHATDSADSGDRAESAHSTYVCPNCGASMLIIETFARGQLPRAPYKSMGAS